ncbi:MAG: class I tRNA ligase family protein [Balneolaceae bacterium]|nr:class I tRNA ligase family protein [Balneolaceae bacterium]
MKHGEYVLPENVPANEFLNLEGRKLSTSRGWAVWLQDYLEEFEADLLRYVLGTILPETKDSDFSWTDFQTKVNSELADVLGNFIFRTTSFTQKYFDGKVPQLKNPSSKDKEALEKIEIQKAKIEENFGLYRIREAISEAMNLARIGNKYFTEMEPWRTRKEDPQACANTLHVCLQISAALSVLFHPVMPSKMEQLRGQLGLEREMDWDRVTQNIIEAGRTIEKGEILFQKIEDEEIEEQLEKLKKRSEEMSEQTTYEPLKEQIEFDDFMAIDLRAGKITEAEKIEKADKLLKLTVNLGFEIRTIVSGIAPDFDPRDVVGQRVCVGRQPCTKTTDGRGEQWHDSDG